MIDLDKDIELYKSKVAFYESQNTRGEYAVTVRELKFVVETLEALRAERSQGDYISRKDLRKQVVAARSWNTPICSGGTEYGEGAIGMADEILELIDNAPPVETFTLEDMQNNYDAGVDSVIGKYDKTKGEWVDHSETDGYVECPFCGSLTTCESNKEELHFCWNCGADMRPRDCKGCFHYAHDGDIPYCELGNSIQERCNKFRE